MDKLVAMQVFVRVVETGSLSAAGQSLGLAPSSVSRRVVELEGLLGVRLLRRTTGSLSLTEAGETYFERSREILRAVEEANLAVTESRAKPSGTLRITVPASIARRHMAPAIAAFQARYPAVRVAMSVTEHVVDTVGEGLDMAIRTGRLEDSSLVARKLGEARRLVCASPSYLERAGRPERAEDLADHACLTFRGDPGSNSWGFRRGEARIEVRATGPFFADDSESLVAAACAGLGVALLPEWLLGPEIAGGRLVEVLSDHPPAPSRTPLYAVYAPGPCTPPKVCALVDFLADRFSRSSAWAERR